MTETGTQPSAGAIRGVAEAVASGRSLWLVVKDGGYRKPASVPDAEPGREMQADWEHPVFLATLDEDEARAQAQKATASLVRLPLTEDYRELGDWPDRGAAENAL